jgi:hypothetical protein
MQKLLVSAVSAPSALGNSAEISASTNSTYKQHLHRHRQSRLGAQHHGREQPVARGLQAHCGRKQVQQAAQQQREVAQHKAQQQRLRHGWRAG